MEKLKGLIRSRKFWAAIVGLLVVLVKAFYPDLPLNEQAITAVVVMLVGYILGVAVEDGLSARAVDVNLLVQPGRAAAAPPVAKGAGNG